MAIESSVDEVYSNSPVVLITGCSTGLGRALVLEAASQRLRVIATARKISTIENLRAPNITVLTLDVTASTSQLEEFANKALKVFGQVDILINNAGYPIAGALEEVSSDQTLAIFKTNFFGSLNVANVFLPHFRARRSGTIINISSMMPYVSTPGSGSYTATKAALDSITQVWAHELAPLKIKVMGVSLGFTRTELLGSNLSTVENTVKNPIPDYANVRAFHEQVRALHGHEPNDVQKVAKRILDVVLTHDELPVMFPLGNDAVTSADEYLNQRRSEFEKWKELGMGVDADKDV
ncbi:putative short-chain oxidoreductase [Lentinula edodes]|uniref:Short-chain oxidoreductase n=1 Tax=Lentinula lateritia TaxID=40482 RepID=A0A9W9A5B8_9AGAR|nr:putative short-chain oxidoreductase [Lentinula edodes]KAJ4473978.1 putative short-chain oxidoreductase [Lentinula edodes]